MLSFLNFKSIVCRIAVGTLMIGVVSGCRSGFRADELPAELLAPAPQSARHVDLSNLARATTGNEIIYVGDVLQVSIATGTERFNRYPTWLLRVSEQGAVNVPLVGPVEVAGMELTQAERMIHDVSVQRGIYRNPQVSVVVQERRSNRVTVVGAVEKPGPVELPVNSSNLLAAIVAAGGLSKDADTVVEIRQPAGGARGNDFVTQAGYTPENQTRSIQVDLSAARIADGRDYRLADGSVVMVRQRPTRTIHVMGLVKRPGQFEMPDDQDLRMLDAIALASGLTTELANRVRIVRQVPGQDESVVIKTTIGSAKHNNADNLRLAPGDVVTVEQTPGLFVWQELQKFVRFAFTASSRLTLF